jgi:hypothetical protein
MRLARMMLSDGTTKHNVRSVPYLNGLVGWRRVSPGSGDQAIVLPVAPGRDAGSVADEAALMSLGRHYRLTVYGAR